MRITLRFSIQGPYVSVYMRICIYINTYTCTYTLKKNMHEYIHEYNVCMCTYMFCSARHRHWNCRKDIRIHTYIHTCICTQIRFAVHFLCLNKQEHYAKQNKTLCCVCHACSTYICKYVQHIHMYICTTCIHVHEQYIHMYVYTSCTHVHVYIMYTCTYITYIQQLHGRWSR